jgi:predicted permease
LQRFLLLKDYGRGVFIQGGFWPNNVIIGLALIMNIFGEDAVSRTVMILT